METEKRIKLDRRVERIINGEADEVDMSDMPALIYNRYCNYRWDLNSLHEELQSNDTDHIKKEYDTVLLMFNRFMATVMYSKRYQDTIRKMEERDTANWNEWYERAIDPSCWDY